MSMKVFNDILCRRYLRKKQSLTNLKKVLATEKQPESFSHKIRRYKKKKKHCFYLFRMRLFRSDLLGCCRCVNRFRYCRLRS